MSELEIDTFVSELTRIFGEIHEHGGTLTGSVKYGPVDVRVGKSVTRVHVKYPRVTMAVVMSSMLGPRVNLSAHDNMPGDIEYSRPSVEEALAVLPLAMALKEEHPNWPRWKMDEAIKDLKS